MNGIQTVGRCRWCPERRRECEQCGRTASAGWQHPFEADTTQLQQPSPLMTTTPSDHRVLRDPVDYRLSAPRWLDPDWSRRLLDVGSGISTHWRQPTGRRRRVAHRWWCYRRMFQRMFPHRCGKSPMNSTSTAVAVNSSKSQLVTREKWTGWVGRIRVRVSVKFSIWWLWIRMQNIRCHCHLQRRVDWIP